MGAIDCTNVRKLTLFRPVVLEGRGRTLQKYPYVMPARAKAKPAPPKNLTTLRARARRISPYFRDEGHRAPTEKVLIQSACPNRPHNLLRSPISHLRKKILTKEDLLLYKMTSRMKSDRSVETDGMTGSQ